MIIRSVPEMDLDLNEYNIYFNIVGKKYFNIYLKISLCLLYIFINMNLDNNTCSFCNKKFSTKSNCTKHQKICKLKNNIEVESIESLKDELKKKDDQLRQKDEHIEFLKSIIETYVNKPTITYNNNNSINTTTNNNLTIKQIVSKLDPIDFQDIKEYMDNYNNNYIDEGAKGFAKFLCDYPFKDKFVTSDFSRNTIAYKTSESDFIRDPESSYLINRSIKENKDEIIEKSENRLDSINKKIKIFSEGNEFDDYIVKKSDIKKHINIAENISSEKLSDKEVSNVFKNKGIDIRQKNIESNCIT